MKITTVIENKSNKEYLFSQYGLSLFVQTNNNNFLIDTGADSLAFENFERLGLDICSLDKIIISNNHNDHIGGLKYFLQANDKIRFYMSSEWRTSIYSKRLFKKKILVSMSEFVKDNIDRAVFIHDCTEVFENVFACRVRHPKADFLCKDKRLKKLYNNKLVSDDFTHEIYVAVVENEELKILSSCSHNGILNIIEDAEMRFPNLKISAFIGGLHFRGERRNSLNCKMDYLDYVIDILNQKRIETLYVCHCTGIKAYNRLKSRSQSSVFLLSTGEVIEV